jgi:glycosyltransferase involved in cell wall biosynthesis
LPTRVFAFTHEPVAIDGRYTRLGHLMPALGRYLHLVGDVAPEVSRLADAALKARFVHPSRVAWRERAWVNAARFRLRTRVAERELNRHRGEFDAILQVQTMFGLGRRPPVPYAVYTDNLLVLTRRHYPEASLLGRREARRFVELESAQCRGAAALFPWSEFVARSLVEDYGCDPSRISIVPGAPRYGAVPLGDRRWGSRTALFVGFEFERKGGLELLAAWPRVRREVPDATLQVVGPPGSPPALPEGVEWIGPLDDSARLGDLYSGADVFAMPSRYESWGFTFQEAMAHGTCCISGEVGGQREIVRNGVSGLNVPGRDPDALAAALVSILGDTARAEAMGRAGWEQIRDVQSWDKIAARMAPGLAAIAA